MELIISNLLILATLIIFDKYNQTKNINTTSDKKKLDYLAFKYMSKKINK